MKKENSRIPGRTLLLRLFFFAFVVGSTLFISASYSHADGPFCQLGSGDPCQEVFALGSGDQPITSTRYGPGMSYVQTVLRAYVFKGIGGQEADTYMLFHLTVTLNPDFNVGLENWLVPSFDGYPDSSTTGDNSTLHIRLWSTNTRITCTLSYTCVQRNYSGLELNNYCYSNGGSQSFGVNGPQLQGAGMTWSASSPTYSWCTLAVPSDVYSRYYDYTLQDATQANSQITEDFVFAQWQQSSNHGFKIGYSVQSHFGELARSTRVKRDGPSIENTFIVYPT